MRTVFKDITNDGFLTHVYPIVVESKLEIFSVVVERFVRGTVNDRDQLSRAEFFEVLTLVFVDGRSVFCFILFHRIANIARKCSKTKKPRISPWFYCCFIVSILFSKYIAVGFCRISFFSFRTNASYVSLDLRYGRSAVLPLSYTLCVFPSHLYF